MLLGRCTISKKINLLDQIRITLRVNHYSKKTEESYTSWIKQFIIFNNKTYPDSLGAEEIKNFLNHLVELKIILKNCLIKDLKYLRNYFL